MNERDYIRATNRVKVSIALNVIHDVLSGDEYGISDDDIMQIRMLLAEAQAKLFKSYNVSTDEDVEMIDIVATKNLAEKSGCSHLLCQIALIQSLGDFDGAVKILADNQLKANNTLDPKLKALLEEVSK